MAEDTYDRGLAGFVSCFCALLIERVSQASFRGTLLQTLSRSEYRSFDAAVPSPVGLSKEAWYDEALRFLEHRRLFSADLVRHVAEDCGLDEGEKAALLELYARERDQLSRETSPPEPAPPTMLCVSHNRLLSPLWYPRRTEDDQDALARIRQLLDMNGGVGRTRYACIVGPLGTGRTSLARAYAALHGEHYHEYLYVDLPKEPEGADPRTYLQRLFKGPDARCRPARPSALHGDPTAETPADALHRVLRADGARILIVLDGLEQVPDMELSLDTRASVDIIFISTQAASRHKPLRLAPLTVDQVIDILRDASLNGWTRQTHGDAVAIVTGLGQQPAVVELLAPLLEHRPPRELLECLERLCRRPVLGLGRHQYPGRTTALVAALIGVIRECGSPVPRRLLQRWQEEVDELIAQVWKDLGYAGPVGVPTTLRALAYLAPCAPVERDLLRSVCRALQGNRPSKAQATDLGLELAALARVGLIMMETDARPSIYPLVQVAVRERLGKGADRDRRAVLEAIARALPSPAGKPLWSPAAAVGRYGAALPHALSASWLCTPLGRVIGRERDRAQLRICREACGTFKQMGRFTAGLSVAASLLGHDPAGDDRWMAADPTMATELMEFAGQCALNEGGAPSAAGPEFWFERCLKAILEHGERIPDLQTRKAQATYWLLVARVEVAQGAEAKRAAVGALSKHVDALPTGTARQRHTWAMAQSRLARGHAAVAAWERDELAAGEVLRVARDTSTCALDTLRDLGEANSLGYANLLQRDGLILLQQALVCASASEWLTLAAARLRQSAGLYQGFVETSPAAHARVLRALALAEAARGDLGAAMAAAAEAEAIERAFAEGSLGLIESTRVCGMVRLLQAVELTDVRLRATMLEQTADLLHPALQESEYIGNEKETALLTFLLYFTHALRHPFRCDLPRLDWGKDQVASTWGPNAVETCLCRRLLAHGLPLNPSDDLG